MKFWVSPQDYLKHFEVLNIIPNEEEEKKINYKKGSYSNTYDYLNKTGCVINEKESPWFSIVTIEQKKKKRKEKKRKIIIMIIIRKGDFSDHRLRISWAEFLRPSTSGDCL